MKRKSPVQHTVKSHTRKGKRVKSYQRGSGTRPKPRRRVVIDTSELPQSAFVRSLPTFKGLKRRGRFRVPEEEIDPGIREICRRINKLPYVAVTGSCEGHTREEYIERGWDVDEMKIPPLGYTPAWVSMYVLADRRFELWDWLKKNVGLDKVDISLLPLFEGDEGFSKFVYIEERPTYVRDKLFQVGVTSKSLRMPLKNKGVGGSK